MTGDKPNTPHARRVNNNNIDRSANAADNVASKHGSNRKNIPAHRPSLQHAAHTKRYCTRSPSLQKLETASKNFALKHATNGLAA